MDQDLALVMGLIAGGFATIGLVAAISEGRGPLAAGLTILISGSLITYAFATKPSGYTLAQIPDVFFNVLSRFIP